MKVSIVIPNYNSGETLVKNLPLLLETGADEIVIVDDGSTDGAVVSIKYLVFSIKQTTKIKIIENSSNLGFSSTVNKGVKEANGEIVVLLNTDVLPEKDFLKFLLPHFADPKVFSVGCLDKSIENGKTVLRGRGLAKWEKGFYLHSPGEVDRSDTAWVSCGSGAFRKKIWEELGGLDPIYNPFYWEDIDLSYRAQKAGYKTLFETKSIVVHKHEEGAIRNKYSPEEIKTISYRNQFLFAWKNMDSVKLWLTHFFWLPYHLITNHEISFYKGFVRALIKI